MGFKFLLQSLAVKFLAECSQSKIKTTTLYMAMADDFHFRMGNIAINPKEPFG